MTSSVYNFSVYLLAIVSKSATYASHIPLTTILLRHEQKQNNFKNVHMKNIFLIALSITILTSCSSKKSMALHPERLSLGMTRQEVISAMGEHIPMKIIGSKLYKNGTIEVGQYYDKKLMYGQGVVEEIYYLYFYNNILVQWGRPQDWQREADRIYEIRYR